MMGWPRYFLAPLAKARAVKSVEPPGGYGITNVMGFAGYSAAIAGRLEAKTMPIKNSIKPRSLHSR
jgi:hypothetical protein